MASTGGEQYYGGVQLFGAGFYASLKFHKDGTLPNASARKVLGLNPVLLLGGITGSMTSGASLSIVTKAVQSSVSALGYTGAYASTNVLLTITGSLILIFD